MSLIRPRDPRFAREATDLIILRSAVIQPDVRTQVCAHCNQALDLFIQTDQCPGCKYKKTFLLAAVLSDIEEIKLRELADSFKALDLDLIGTTMEAYQSVHAYQITALWVPEPTL